VTFGLNPFAHNHVSRRHGPIAGIQRADLIAALKNPITLLAVMLLTFSPPSFSGELQVVFNE
jgi:hypothetical protein